MKRANLILLAVLFLICASHNLAGASESFIESIYEAGQEAAKSRNFNEVQPEEGGGEAEKKVVEVYQPDIENRLMEDIFKLLKQVKSAKIIDLRKNVRIVTAKFAKNLGRSAGYLTVRTLKVGSNKATAPSSQEKKPEKKGLVVRTKPAPTSKPVAKPAAKPAAKPVAKPAAKPAAKPVAKPVVKPVTKPEEKSVPKPVVKPTTIQVKQPAPKAPARPVVKPVSKPVNTVARITDSPASLIERLEKMGFIIEGGIKSSGGRWDSEQLFYLIKLLEVLPAHFSKTTKKFKRVPNFGGNRGVMGYVFAGQPDVHITDWGVRPIKFEETLVHEMAHCWMFAKENLKLKEAWCNSFWPGNKQPDAAKEQPTSVYGHTNVFEDFAEAARCYWQDGAKMRSTHPQRWSFLNKYVFKGVSYLNKQNIASADSTTLAKNSVPTRQY